VTPLTTGQQRRLTLARRLLDRAHESLDDHGIFGPWHAVVEACDAAELVLLVVDDVRVPPPTSKKKPQVMFGQLIAQLLAVSPTVQQWEKALYRLSELRNNAKHAGIIPSEHDAQSSVAEARVSLESITKAELGYGLDHSAMTGWLEHRLVADALARAAKVLEQDAAGLEDLVHPLAEAYGFCRHHAEWLVGARGSVSRGLVELARDRNREVDADVRRLLSDLANGAGEHLDQIRAELAFLRLGVPGEDFALWDTYLPEMHYTSAGSIHFGQAPVHAIERGTATDLYRRLFRLAERLDGKHARVPNPHGEEPIALGNDVIATFGRGEHERHAVLCRSSRHYARAFHGSTSEGRVSLTVFGIDVEIPSSEVLPTNRPQRPAVPSPPAKRKTAGRTRHGS
jgi:hypothetical protein